MALCQDHGTTKGSSTFIGIFKNSSFVSKFPLTRRACGIICNVANNSAEWMILKPPPYRSGEWSILMKDAFRSHNNGFRWKLQSLAKFG